MNVQDGPLKGIKVLDIGNMLAAPLAAAVLADQGAEVIKIEPPGIGDVMRFVGATCNGVSALFQGTNRGKRSSSSWRLIPMYCCTTFARAWRKDWVSTTKA